MLQQILLWASLGCEPERYLGPVGVWGRSRLFSVCLCSALFNAANAVFPWAILSLVLGSWALRWSSAPDHPSRPLDAKSFELVLDLVAESSDFGLA